MRPGPAFRESIADLWGCPDGPKKRPGTQELFEAVSREALACLSHTDWDVRVRRIENILSVIRWRMRSHQDEMHQRELDRMLKREGGDGDVERED